MVERIVLWPLGGFALCGSTDGGAAADIKVAIAGPLTHIPQGLFWILIYAVAGGGDFITFSRTITTEFLSSGGLHGFLSILSVHAFWLNIDLMVFNLFLPAYPLDGGRCMASVLILSGFGSYSAAIITSVTAMAIAVVMTVWGLVSFVHLGHPTGLFAALVGFYIYSSSSRLYNLAQTNRVSEHPLFSQACFEAGDYVPLSSES